jgi:hypothetical protein
MRNTNAGSGPDGTGTASSRLDRFGDRRHELTAADSRNGGLARWEVERERRAELERQAVEKLESRLLDALDTYLEVMDNQGAPDAARLQAADRIVERLIGKVGERLTMHQEQRTEVTVRYDVERLCELVSELQRLGAIGGETVD